ncbi:hypothetical protein Zm00014a_031475 [Zea mays]|uniref:Uncharacterized protein n=1 Tax=Zea mays TaxID=4577 RepID=A0A3L6D7Q1_MAIZE|nr:hypothetical protein Zm00014a_031475 [Zea mays]
MEVRGFATTTASSRRTEAGTNHHLRHMPPFLTLQDAGELGSTSLAPFATSRWRCPSSATTFRRNIALTPGMLFAPSAQQSRKDMAAHSDCSTRIFSSVDAVPGDDNAQKDDQRLKLNNKGATASDDDASSKLGLEERLQRIDFLTEILMSTIL